MIMLYGMNKSGRKQMRAYVIGLATLGLAGAFAWVPTLAEPGAGGEALVEANADPDALVFFEEQVRPVLERRCVRCHGGEHVRGELNFATRETTLQGGESGALINWDQTHESLLLRAISYDDVDYEMPPTGKLPEAEIETLTRWVAMGMPWTPGEAGNLADPQGQTTHAEGPVSIEEGREYWAYRPLVRPQVPEVDDAQWSENPIDAFIYARLAANGLSPSPEADRITLIRRATYNLTGLPPTPEEVDAFINDDRPDAWERVIDRLLASPHYGEQWARHWMDIARYAETNGYERDGTKQNIWRYRDYLIRAFNDDEPYDRFVREHIAGDLLADGNADSVIATGFMRLQIWDDEPVDRVQARADYISDIVDTTSGAFLATSVGCARCHDHKRDPILQSDYYAMYAFFNNIEEADRRSPGAIMVSLRDEPHTDEQRQELEQWDNRVRELREQVALAEQAFIQATATRFEQAEPQPIAPDSRGEHQAWRYMTETPADGWFLQQFDDRAWPTANGGFGFSVNQSFLPNEWSSDNIYLRRTFRLTEIPRYLTLSIAHKGPTAVYINGIQVYQANGATGQSHRQVQLPAAALNALVIGSNSFAVTSNEGPDAIQFVDAGLYSGVVDPRLAIRAAIDAGGEAALGAEALAQYRLARSELDRLLATPVSQPYPAMVATEQGRDAPEQHIHQRGNANVPGETVEPRFPMVLGGQVPLIPELPEGTNATGRRLALADWLASADNPLTARVMVNRIWQYQFGRGIVRSSSDFGQLGDQPTHPELINYLASEFIERDWSIKQMQRLIMTSRAYRMSSAANDAGLQVDPGNNLFWRFDMRRLTAEEFRDSLLMVNGSLNPERFGPSIFTLMPDEVLQTASRPDQAWGRSTEAQRNRRSIYIHVKRSLREPLLASLDQAPTDSPCPVRFATTVPTQSLITLNSEVMQVESAEFAQRLRREAGDSLEAQVRLGLHLVMCREPSEQEVASNVAFVQRVMREHDLSADRALELFCLVSYNLNAFVYLD